MACSSHRDTDVADLAEGAALPLVSGTPEKSHIRVCSRGQSTHLGLRTHILSPALPGSKSAGDSYAQCNLRSNRLGFLTRCREKPCPPPVTLQWSLLLLGGRAGDGLPPLGKVCVGSTCSSLVFLFVCFAFEELVAIFNMQQRRVWIFNQIS